jgi:hypothetical protein
MQLGLAQQVVQIKIEWSCPLATDLLVHDLVWTRFSMDYLMDCYGVC